MKLECIFFERQKWDVCRLCEGDNVECPEYILRNPTRKSSSVETSTANEVVRYSVTEDNSSDIRTHSEIFHTRQIDVVGKPMIPSARKTSGNVNSVTAEIYHFPNATYCNEINDSRNSYSSSDVGLQIKAKSVNEGSIPFSDTPFYNHGTIKKPTLPRNFKDWIRRCNDRLSI